MSDAPTLFPVPVRGGDLVVARWGSGPTVVVAAHGITANHVSWSAVATALPDDVTLLAPDLRGRGGSAGLPGPWGIGTHAEDVIAILDHVGIEQAVLVGHSMGAFVVAKAAERHPGRVQRLVLVDGGVSLPVDWPDGMTAEAKIQLVIGPALDRLRMTFPSPEAYLEHWRPHPAIGEIWGPLVEDYLRYDIHEVDGAWRSKVELEAVVADGTDTIEDPSATTAIERIDVPTRWLYAPRGILNQTPGLYPTEVVESVAERLPHVTTTLVEDVNHYAIAMDPAGAAIVADAVAAQDVSPRR
jgi:pimeloyl-ACP methyl ester carboxylesterase